MRVFGFRMWAVKNSQNRRSACSVGKNSTCVDARGAGAREVAPASVGTRSGNMEGECTRILMVHKRRYVPFTGRTH